MYNINYFLKEKTEIFRIFCSNLVVTKTNSRPGTQVERLRGRKVALERRTVGHVSAKDASGVEHQGFEGGGGWGEV